MGDSGDNVIKMFTLGAGKTAILYRLSGKPFQSGMMNTLGLDMVKISLTLNRVTYELKIWDTAGQERFESITQGYLRGAKCVMLVYDVTSTDSFDRKWYECLRKEADETVSIVLLANKVDLVDERVVCRKSGQDFAGGLHIPYFETSAKTGQNLQQALNTLVSNYISRQSPDGPTRAEAPVKPDARPNAGQSDSSSCC